MASAALALSVAAASLLPLTAGPLTRRVFDTVGADQAKVGATGEIGGAGGARLLSSLLAQEEALLKTLARQPRTPRKFVQEREGDLSHDGDSTNNATFDLVVCGGTLGILLACALQLHGWRVSVIEAGPLQGRDQEWNTSEEELQTLVKCGVLSTSELSDVMWGPFGPMRCAFGEASLDSSSAPALEARGVLDVGVFPARLIEIVRRRFEAHGGVVFERTPVAGVHIYHDGARVDLGGTAAAGTTAKDNSRSGEQVMERIGQKKTANDIESENDVQEELRAIPKYLITRLVVDCMGHRSPIALQARGGQLPDGVCVQVGCCADGAFARHWGEQADFFVTSAPALPDGPNQKARVQYFWQAFPEAAGGRSVYMFTYLTPSSEQPSLLPILETFWEQLRSNQRIDEVANSADGDGSQAKRSAGDDFASPGQLDPLNGLDVKRLLFGWFPTYRDNSPLPSQWDRVVSVGDASAVQSPLSFGGFCAMLRHLPRLTRGIDEALRADALSRRDLALLSPYLPNLCTSWMNAKAMSSITAPPGAPSPAPSTLINRLLDGNFRVLSRLPSSATTTYLRDVTKLSTLLGVLLGMSVSMSSLLPAVLVEVGAVQIAGFVGHLLALAAYTLASVCADAVRDGRSDAGPAMTKHATTAVEAVGVTSATASRTSAQVSSRAACRSESASATKITAEAGSVGTSSEQRAADQSREGRQPIGEVRLKGPQHNSEAPPMEALTDGTTQKFGEKPHLPVWKYTLNRYTDAFRYGSGLDADP